MSEEFKNGPVLLQRSVILDGLRALYLTQHRFDRFLKEDSYACGYREGFEDALLSVAQMVGVAKEFEAIRQHLKSLSTSELPIYTTNTNNEKQKS